MSQSQAKKARKNIRKLGEAVWQARYEKLYDELANGGMVLHRRNRRLTIALIAVSLLLIAVVVYVLCFATVSL